jgi:hypothetical protein
LESRSRSSEIASGCRTRPRLTFAFDVSIGAGAFQVLPSDGLPPAGSPASMSGNLTEEPSKTSRLPSIARVNRSYDWSYLM